MTPAGDHLQRAFRHRPPRVQSDWIPRPRLASRLARRFDLDVLVVVAPAGYGKTTALAQAVAANEADPAGTDLWVQCRPADADPEVLAEAIWRAAGLDPTGRAADSGALVDALLRYAPHPVCLTFDDVHTVDPDSAGFALLAALLEDLPDHAHLVLAGRTAPPLPLARRRVEGRCEEVASADLEFDDEELGIAGAPTASGDHARWPALARLARADRPDATVDYLLEEVAAGLGPDRLAAISALSLVGTVDDPLARAASDGRADAAELLDELPLVQRSSDRSIQLHDLWSTALVGGDALDDATAAAVGRVAAEVRRRGQHREAAELYARAGDPTELERTCVDYVSQPLMFTSASELQALAALVSEALPGRPIAALLNATVPIVGDEQRSIDAFAEVAAAARAVDDRTVETIALQNITNLQGMLDPAALPPEVADRAEVLATDGDRRARSLLAIVRSFATRGAAEPEACARHLAELDPAGSVVDQTMFAFGMGDLGRPEDVATPVGETDPTGAAARAGGQYLAQAMWLRGDVSPEVALELGTQLVDVTDQRGVAHVRLSTSAVLALVALGAGDLVQARRFTDAARELTSQTVSQVVRAFADLAEAATLLHERGEDDARRAIEAAFAVRPIDRWPTRPYLYALPLVYVSAPEVRATLDACRFGPALTAARDAGAALVALRDGDDAPALALPWHRRSLLRAHVLPPHLVELAAAGAAAGVGDAQALLEEVPHQRELLAAVGEGNGPGSRWARERVATLPARPPHDVRLEVLGPMRCWRGETEVADAGWARRERVRQLLALLVLHQRISRREAAELLWPDLPEDKALANLRVNLSHLHKVLEPGAEPSTRRWFVRAEGEFLEVCSDGLSVDAADLDRACARARRLDDEGQGTQALAAYEEAIAHFRGDYLVDWPDARWAQVERLRLRTLATSAMVRVGQLALARGEPEAAGSWAARVTRLEPLDDGAHRLFAQALVAQGNRAGAAATLRDLLARLAEERLAPERETSRLAASLGIDPP